MRGSLINRILSCLAISISTSFAASVYEASNAYCSQTPTIYPFVGGYQLDGNYTLIRYGDINYTDRDEAPPTCGDLSIEPNSDFPAIKTIVTRRSHPFENGALYTKTMHEVTQSNAVISPGRWISSLGLFQVMPGPLGTTRSLMFLQYTKDRNSKIESFLYANCGMHPNGGMFGPGVGDPSMSEWGIAVRVGSEGSYDDDLTLSRLYDEALTQAFLPPVSNMTIVKGRGCV